ncbi:MAG: hypothetical protein ACYTJ0_10685 [Planctomycetota bacterium]|jgi:hypothetical protein
MQSSGTDPALVTTAVLITIGLFAVVSLAYKLLDMRRQQLWRALAGALGGELLDDGSPYGCVQASIDRRPCRVRTDSLHRSIVTKVEVECDVPAVPATGLALAAECFGTQTDWRRAATEGRVERRVFVTALSLPAMVPLDEAQRTWLDGVFDAQGTGPAPEAIREAMESIDALAIRLTPTAASITFSGVITDRARLRTTLQLLGDVVARAESAAEPMVSPLQPAA